MEFCRAHLLSPAWYRPTQETELCPAQGRRDGFEESAIVSPHTKDSFPVHEGCPATKQDAQEVYSHVRKNKKRALAS
jgi:hypothetical protein